MNTDTDNKQKEQHSPENQVAETAGDLGGQAVGKALRNNLSGTGRGSFPNPGGTQAPTQPPPPGNQQTDAPDHGKAESGSARTKGQDMAGKGNHSSPGISGQGQHNRHANQPGSLRRKLDDKKQTPEEGPFQGQNQYQPPPQQAGAQAVPYGNMPEGRHNEPSTSKTGTTGLPQGGSEQTPSADNQTAGKITSEGLGGPQKAVSGEKSSTGTSGGEKRSDGEFGGHSPGQGSATGGTEAGFGATGGSTSGSAGGGSAGAGVGSGAAGGGGASAGAGAGAAASSSAAAGAAVGTAVAPVVGTAIGAAAGAAAGPLIKKIVKAAIALVIIFLFLIAVFNYIPSSLMDNPAALWKRAPLEKTYNAYYEDLLQQYRNDLINTKQKTGSRTRDFAEEYQEYYHAGCPDDMDSRPVVTNFWGLNPMYGALFSPEDIDKVDAAFEQAEQILRDNGYSSSSSRLVEKWESVADYTMTDLEVLDSLEGNINFIISLMDIKKDDWFFQLFGWMINQLTGGWFSEFVHDLTTWWDGLWNEYIKTQMVDVQVVTDVTPSYNSRGKLRRVTVTVRVVCIYDYRDEGVGFYVDKVAKKVGKSKEGLTDEQLGNALEMAYYLGDLFGTDQGGYIGGYIKPGSGIPGYGSETPQETGTGTLIMTEIAKLPPGDVPALNLGSQVIPILSPLEEPPSSSLYGWRDVYPYWHTGIDFGRNGAQFTMNRAAMDGVVLFRRYMSEGYGNYIVLYHGQDSMGNHICTLYAHFESIYPEWQPGVSVSAGDILGPSGMTGIATGRHLHFEYLENATPQNPIYKLDCLAYLQRQVG